MVMGSDGCCSCRTQAAALCQASQYLYIHPPPTHNIYIYKPPHNIHIHTYTLTNNPQNPKNTPHHLYHTIGVESKVFALWGGIQHSVYIGPDCLHPIMDTWGCRQMSSMYCMVIGCCAFLYYTRGGGSNSTPPPP